MGQFVVDDLRPEDTWADLHTTTIHMTVPAKNAEGAGKNNIDKLCDGIIVHLQATSGRFETVNKLTTDLRAAGITITKSDMAPALQRLANRGQIEWPYVPDRPTTLQ